MKLGQIEHLKILLLVTLLLFPFDAWDRICHLIVALLEPCI